MEKLMLIFVGIGLGLAVVKLIYHFIPRLEKHALDKSKSKQEQEYIHCKTKIQQAGLSLTEYNGTIYIGIKTMQELTEARQKLRQVLGLWNDKKEMIWNSGNHGLCDWRTNDYPIVIRLSCPVEDFPEELQSERCRFKKQTIEKWDYVCE